MLTSTSNLLILNVEKGWKCHPLNKRLFGMDFKQFKIVISTYKNRWIQCNFNIFSTYKKKRGITIKNQLKIKIEYVTIVNVYSTCNIPIYFIEVILKFNLSYYLTLPNLVTLTPHIYLFKLLETYICP